MESAGKEGRGQVRHGAVSQDRDLVPLTRAFRLERLSSPARWHLEPMIAIWEGRKKGKRSLGVSASGKMSCFSLINA